MDLTTLKTHLQEFWFEATWPQTIIKIIKTHFNSAAECVDAFKNDNNFLYHIGTFKKSDFLETLAEWSGTDLQKINHHPEGWYEWLNTLKKWSIEDKIMFMSARMDALWGATSMLSKWFPSLDDEELYHVGLIKPEWIQARYGFVQSPKTLLLWLKQNPKMYFLKAINSKNERRFLSLWKMCESQTLLDVITYITKQELTINENDTYTKIEDIAMWNEMLRHVPWNAWLRSSTLKVEQKNVLLTLFLHIRMCAKISGHEETLKLTNNIIKMWPNGQYWRNIQDVTGAGWKFDMAKSFAQQDINWSMT